MWYRDIKLQRGIPEPRPVMNFPVSQKEPKCVGLKRGSLILVFGLFAVLMSPVWAMDVGAQGQTQSDIALQAQQGGQAATPGTPVLKTQKDQVNYAIGVHLIGNFKRQGVDIDLDMVMKGMRDAYSGKKLLMSDGELQRAFMVYQSEMRRTQSKILSTKAEQNKNEGKVFLEENRKNEGIIALPSGLQYKVLKMGEGKKPTDADSVECHYRGTFINGKEFDNSYKRGGPVTFRVKGVIPGWAEALKLMPVGSKWRIFIPSRLGYGERGAGNVIEPNTMLIFEIELLAIK